MLAMIGCRDNGGPGDAERFCELVNDNIEALRAVPQTPQDIDELIDLWTDVGDVAPLAIEPDWSAHVLNFETARDSDDQEEILARMFATERSSVAIATWLGDNCAIDWGPVSTIVPQAATTTTVPTTTVPAG